MGWFRVKTLKPKEERFYKKNKVRTFCDAVQIHSASLFIDRRLRILMHVSYSAECQICFCTYADCTTTLGYCHCWTGCFVLNWIEKWTNTYLRPPASRAIVRHKGQSAVLYSRSYVWLYSVQLYVFLIRTYNTESEQLTFIKTFYIASINKQTVFAVVKFFFSLNK